MVHARQDLYTIVFSLIVKGHRSLNLILASLIVREPANVDIDMTKVGGVPFLLILGIV